MNRDKTEKKLRKLFSEFQYHEKILDEINELVVKKGRSREFVMLLEKNIKFVKTLGNDVTKTSNFEKLRNCKDLYSMKFKSKDMNLRILFSYDSRTSTILLHCFYEKQDSGVDSYSKHIPIALRRKSEMEAKK